MPNQPSTNDILQAVLKECGKENLKYKMVAISCAGDVLKATKEDRFREFSDIVIPLIKKVVTAGILAGLAYTEIYMKDFSVS